MPRTDNYNLVQGSYIVTQKIMVNGGMLLPSISMSEFLHAYTGYAGKGMPPIILTVTDC